jgi:hypothetical protein
MAQNNADPQARSGEHGVNHERHESHEINLPQRDAKTAKESVGRTCRRRFQREVVARFVPQPKSRVGDRFLPTDEKCQRIGCGGIFHPGQLKKLAWDSHCVPEDSGGEHARTPTPINREPAAARGNAGECFERLGLYLRTHLRRNDSDGPEDCGLWLSFPEQCLPPRAEYGIRDAVVYSGLLTSRIMRAK